MPWKTSNFLELGALDSRAEGGAGFVELREGFIDVGYLAGGRDKQARVESACLPGDLLHTGKTKFAEAGRAEEDRVRAGRKAIDYVDPLRAGARVALQPRGELNDPDERVGNSRALLVCYRTGKYRLVDLCRQGQREEEECRQGRFHG